MIEKNIMINKLLKKFSPNTNFILYGAGYVAKTLLHILEENGYRPLYIVITEKSTENNTQYYGYNVYSLKNKVKEIIRDDILVVIAVTKLYEEEILKNLKQSGITRILPCSSYYYQSIRQLFYHGHEQLKDSDLIENLREWYIEQFGETFDIIENRESKELNRNILILVVLNLSPRVVKIVKSLRDAGKDIEVYLHGSIESNSRNNFMSMLFETGVKLKYYNEVEELLIDLLCRKYKVIVHIFSNNYFLYQAMTLIVYKKYIGKVIFETYDIINGFYVDSASVTKEQKEIERYSLENADGIVYREFSLDYLINEMGFDIKGNTQCFWDYCNNENLSDCNIDKKKNELHLCYSGRVIDEGQYDDCPFELEMEFIEACEKAKCHLHVYPTVNDKIQYRKYIEKAKDSKYFHFYDTLPYSQIIKTISQYDYGIIPVRDDIWQKEQSGYNRKEKYIYAATNKVFDYLEAGLPVISAIPLYYMQFFFEKGAAFCWTRSQYDFELLYKVKEIMREKALQLREELQINKNIYRLLDFYKCI